MNTPLYRGLKPRGSINPLSQGGAADDPNYNHNVESGLIGIIREREKLPHSVATSLRQEASRG
ncbi:MAG: hypothetical protein CBC13_08875 [Planctomycetia bacterium TMED53]|nr:MAG: hypothetical protein CBC13_08875 [Planctomycetia bacterium TMED53]